MATKLSACAAFISREYGFNEPLSTRPPSSLKNVLEHIPHSGKLEYSFIKEMGSAGRIVGAATARFQGAVNSSVSSRRAVRSFSHTHTVTTDPRVQTYMSPTDFEWVENRLDGKDGYGREMKRMNVFPIKDVRKTETETREGEAIGFSSIHLRKKWMWIEQNNPESIRLAVHYYRRMDDARVAGEISTMTYFELVQDFWTLMREWGMQIKVRAYPGYKVENGFLTPAE